VARKQRDYKAEYKRRLERGASRGVSKSIARGHPPNGVIGFKLAKLLGVKPGTKVEKRPKYKRPKKETRTFEQILEDSGFRNFLTEARKEVLRRETDIDNEDEIESIATSQEEFITVIMNSAHSEKEAYTSWFSPK
jgi:CRISPR/Cas system-associated protein Cas5 (RAMP superfamily)